MALLYHCSTKRTENSLLIFVFILQTLVYNILLFATELKAVAVYSVLKFMKIVEGTGN